MEFFKHSLTEEDIASAAEAMRSIFLTTGPRVKEFEKLFASYLKAPEAVGLTSCTGALHLALLRHGIKTGDEVITSPMTYVATAASILETGAKPVFADVSPGSALLTPESAESAITKKTKAIIPVHIYGRMADMKGFSRLAKKHSLALIEDAAQCMEGMRDGIRPGQLSNAACFSFYATKSITCGEGGAIVCKSPEEASWYRAARQHGISKTASCRYSGEFQHWDMEMMGWKYNMDDIQAGLLIPQIRRIEEYRRRREELINIYRDLLYNEDNIEMLEPPSQGEISASHMFTILVSKEISRDRVVSELLESGIGCTVNYRSVHTLSYFRENFGYRPEDFPAAYDIGERTITLPLYPGLTRAEIELVCRSLKAILGSSR